MQRGRVIHDCAQHDAGYKLMCVVVIGGRIPGKGCQGSCDPRKLDYFCYNCIHWHENRRCGAFGVDVLRRCGDIVV